MGGMVGRHVSGIHGGRHSKGREFGTGSGGQGVQRRRAQSHGEAGGGAREWPTCRGRPSESRAAAYTGCVRRRSHPVVVVAFSGRQRNVAARAHASFTATAKRGPDWRPNRNDDAKQGATTLGSDLPIDANPEGTSCGVPGSCHGVATSGTQCRSGVAVKVACRSELPRQSRAVSSDTHVDERGCRQQGQQRSASRLPRCQVRTVQDHSSLRWDPLTVLLSASILE